VKLLTFKIILEKPTPNVTWGLQKGKGSDYETVQKQVSQSNDLVFEFTAEAKTTENGEPDFFGPFVQGKKGERFVYLDIGTCAGEAGSPWSRRLKIPLRGITRQIFEKAGDTVLQCMVAGTGKDGGPNCATVKPFNGWNIYKSN